MELITVINGEARTSTETIAKGVAQPHASVIKMVRKYRDLLKEFGTFGFQIRKSGGRKVEYSFLNERQATFLITLMRNTEKVVAFKFALVKQFYKMAEELAHRAALAVRQQFLLETESVSLEHSRPFGIGLARRGTEKRAIERELSLLDIQLQLNFI